MTDQKKRGNKLGVNIFFFLLKIFGLRPAYGLLYPVCFYYLIFDRTAVRGGQAYLKRRFPDDSGLKMMFHTYRLFISQGKQLIDRTASASGVFPFEFNLEGTKDVDSIIGSEKGAVVVTAHAGNWQIALPALSRFEKKVSVVMLPEHNDAVKKLTRSLDDDVISVISSGEHLGGVVEMMNAVNRGEIVSFMGDRPYDFDALEIDFLGNSARFPYGAFMIAAAAKVPVVTLLASKTGRNSYTVDISQVLHPEYESRKNKKEQLKKWVQLYADILTEFVERHPYQCFLFQDIWEHTNKD